MALVGGCECDEGDAGAEALSCGSFSLRRWNLLEGLDEWCLGTGSEGRSASVSWTVRMCLARASERVKERSHSAGVSQVEKDRVKVSQNAPGNVQ